MRQQCTRICLKKIFIKRALKHCYDVFGKQTEFRLTVKQFLVTRHPCICGIQCAMYWHTVCQPIYGWKWHSDGDDTMRYTMEKCLKNRTNQNKQAPIKLHDTWMIWNNFLFTIPLPPSIACASTMRLHFCRHIVNFLLVTPFLFSSSFNFFFAFKKKMPFRFMPHLMIESKKFESKRKKPFWIKNNHNVNIVVATIFFLELVQHLLFNAPIPQKRKRYSIEHLLLCVK